MKQIEKDKGEYWSVFRENHSVATRMWVEENYGKAISKKQVINDHKDTCMSKKYGYRYCGKSLFKYLSKFGYIKPI